MSRRKSREEVVYQASLIETVEDTINSANTIKTKSFIKPLTAAQRHLVKSIKNNKYTVAMGPAGTGKTLISLFTGIQLFNNPESTIERLFYIRAFVDDEVEKDIGALPGNQNEKLKPLAYPVLDNMLVFMKEHQAHYMLDEEKIEVLPLYMLKGRSLNNSFIIVDECQNTNTKQMKNLLTRVGKTSKMVICGDPEQVDSRFCPINNGMADFWRKVTIKNQQMAESDYNYKSPAGLVRFERKDIIRDEDVRWVLDLYD